MAVLQCGGCDRLISVSVVSGGNPVALADPKRWSLTRRVCTACRKSLCDQCAPASASHCPLCKAALPAPDAAGRAAPGRPAEAEDDSGVDDGGDAGDGAVRADLVEARRWLLAAVLGALVATVAVLGRSGTANILATLLGLVFAFVGGWNGVARLVRAGAASPAWKVLGPIGFLLPPFSAIPLAWLLWRAHARLAALEGDLQRARRAAAARERARRRAQADARPAPAAAPAVPRPATNGGILQATASIKVAGLQGVEDGKVLKASLKAGQQLPDDQQPVVMAYQGFGVVFLVDDGNQYHYANHAEMARAGLTPQGLLETGLRNLVRRVNGEPGLKVAPNGAIHALLMGGDFEASLLLLDELWDGPLKQQAPGGFVVALPARDICAFADARSKEGIAELSALAAKVTARGDHTITDKLYQRRDGRWHPLA